MEFKTPDFVEIKMDAEIGSYQESEEPTRDPLFVSPAGPPPSQASDAPRS